MSSNLPHEIATVLPSSATEKTLFVQFIDKKKIGTKVRREAVIVANGNMNLSLRKETWDMDLVLPNTGLRVRLTNLRGPYYNSGNYFCWVEILHPNIPVGYKIHLPIAMANFMKTLAEVGEVTKGELVGEFCYEPSGYQLKLEVLSDEMKESKEIARLINSARFTSKWIPGHKYLMKNGQHIIYLGEVDNLVHSLGGSWRDVKKNEYTLFQEVTDQYGLQRGKVHLLCYVNRLHGYLPAGQKAPWDTDPITFLTDYIKWNLDLSLQLRYFSFAPPALVVRVGKLDYGYSRGEIWKPEVLSGIDLTEELAGIVTRLVGATKIDQFALKNKTYAIAPEIGKADKVFSEEVYQRICKIWRDNVENDCRRYANHKVGWGNRPDPRTLTVDDVIDYHISSYPYLKTLLEGICVNKSEDDIRAMISSTLSECKNIR